MKKLFLALTIAFAALASASAQTVLAPALEYNFPLASSTGVVGNYLILDSPLGNGPTSSFTVQAYITGTLPSVCTFEVQSSPDNIAWDTGSASISGDQSCAATTVLTYSFFSKPIRYLRVNVGTLTGADGTTRIHFFYTQKGLGN